MRAISIVGLVILLASAAFADQYKKISQLRDHAKDQIEAGHADAERDIGPLIDMLRTSKDTEDQQHLIDALVDLGRASGTSPAAVKEYVITQTTPIFLTIASNRSNTAFL